MLQAEIGGSFGGALLGVTRTRPADGTTRIRLTGELDLATVPLLDAALAARGHAAAVTLDLSELEFADCAALGCILEWIARSRRERWRLDVDPALSPQVARLVALTGTGDQLWPTRARRSPASEQPLP
jgi:anti-anti-sigma factor